MANLWKQQGVPHKGWTLENVYDVREDGQSEDDTLRNLYDVWSRKKSLCACCFSS